MSVEDGCIQGWVFLGAFGRCAVGEVCGVVGGSCEGVTKWRLEKYLMSARKIPDCAESCRGSAGEVYEV